MTIYSRAISSVAGTYVAVPDASATTQTAIDDLAVAGAVVRAKRGRPFEPTYVNANNLQTVLGTPHKISDADGIFEPVRHIFDAVQEGSVIAVRAVDSATYKYPLLTLTSNSGTPVVKSANGYNEAPELDSGTPAEDLLTIYVYDGDSSENRKLTVSDDTDSGLLRFVVTNLDASGNTVVELDHLASLNPNAIDDFGKTAWIEAVFEQNNAICRVAVKNDATDADIRANIAGFVDVTFDGGTAGDAVTTVDYVLAANTLKALPDYVTAFISAGCYDANALSVLETAADERLVPFYFDLQPTATFAAAIAEKSGLSLSSYHTRAFHFPYTALDPFFGVRCSWGISGAAFAAKAIGLKKFTGQTAGVHYSFAGQAHGIIKRNGLKLIANLGTPNYNEMFKARINKLSHTPSGLVYIDDAITCQTANNYLLYAHVGDTVDEVTKQLAELANSLRHSPDGITESGLVNGGRRICDAFVASGALVQPSDVSADGEDEYRLIITQKEKDLWEIQPELSVTGSARRMSIKPILIK